MWQYLPQNQGRWLWVPAFAGTTRKLGFVPSRIAAIFAEQIQLLLHRAIGKTEQHRIRVGLVGDPLPARHHEQVARAPFEGLLADPRAALAFDRREHGGVS